MQVLIALYELIHNLERYGHPVPMNALPFNGIYFFFESGETFTFEGVSRERIVRIGTHSVDGRFRGRIRQHYGNVGNLGGNHNGSVFRKHVGGALMRRANPEDPRLPNWFHQNGPGYPEVEEMASHELREHFTFCCVPVANREKRLAFESGLIALCAQYHHMAEPSEIWLGRYAAAPNIRESGLWNTQHVHSEPLTPAQLSTLETLAMQPFGQGM